MHHDMTKCPNYENCITDLRKDKAKLEAENKALLERAGKAERQAEILAIDSLEWEQAYNRQEKETTEADVDKKLAWAAK